MNRLDVYLADDELYVQGKPRIELMRGDEFAIDIKKSAKGWRMKQAIANADDIEYFWMQKDAVLKIDPVFNIRKEGKLRDQKLQVVITVPEGLNVEVAEELEWVVDNELD